MGAWGLKSFENDDACDWFIEFEDHGVGVVKPALDAVANADPEDMDAELESQAIAAAEVIAAAQDGDTSRLPERADKILSRYEDDVKGAALASIAANVIERIMSRSELRELWEEVDGLDNWLSDLTPLKSRLKS